MQKLNVAHHPKALWFLSFSQTFYTFSFGSITSFLILYLIHNLQIVPSRAFEIYAAMTAFIYVLPLVGGYLGEKFGYILAITLGYIVVFLGFTLLSMPASKNLMYLGIAFFATGNACVIPNTNALIGLHYSADSPLRNSAYTLYFLIYNIGFLVSPLVAGYVSLDNDAWVFVLGAINVIIGMIIFLYCIKVIEPKAKFSIKPQLNYSLIKRSCLLVISLMLIIACTILLLKRENFHDKFLMLLVAVTSIGLLVAAKKQDRLQRLKMLTFLLLCIFAISFWALYMIVPSFLTIFISQNINRHVLGLVIPPSGYYSLDALFVIILGFFFTWLWQYCAEKKKDISLFAKFAFALLAIGIAYLILALGTSFADQSTHLVSSFWLVFAYVFIAMGELLISPIALAMVGVLMPKGQEGLGMGIWQAFMGLAAIASGYLANLVKTPSQGDPLLTNPLYISAFLKMGLTTVGFGLIMLLLVPKIKGFLSHKPKSL